MVYRVFLCLVAPCGRLLLRFGVGGSTLRCVVACGLVVRTPHFLLRTVPCEAVVVVIVVWSLVESSFLPKVFSFR